MLHTLAYLNLLPSRILDPVWYPLPLTSFVIDPLFLPGKHFAGAYIRPSYLRRTCQNEKRDRQRGRAERNREKTEIPLTLSLGNNYRDKNGARLRIMHWGIASVMT